MLAGLFAMIADFRLSRRLMKRSISWTTLLTLLVLVAPHAGSRPAFAQSRVSTTPIGDYPLPPASLAQTIATVDLVVYGKVTKAGEPQHKQTPGGLDYVLRFPSVKVLEVLASPPNVKGPREISIRQVGGTVVVDGRELSSAYNEMLLQPGEAVVLFLKRTEADDSFYIAYGPGGLIRVDADRGRASIPNQLRHVQEVGGRSVMSEEDLLKAIRKASHKQ